MFRIFLKTISGASSTIRNSYFHCWTLGLLRQHITIVTHLSSAKQTNKHQVQASVLPGFLWIVSRKTAMLVLCSLAISNPTSITRSKHLFPSTAENSFSVLWGPGRNCCLCVNEQNTSLAVYFNCTFYAETLNICLDGRSSIHCSFPMCGWEFSVVSCKMRGRTNYRTFLFCFDSNKNKSASVHETPTQKHR